MSNKTPSATGMRIAEAIEKSDWDGASTEDIAAIVDGEIQPLVEALNKAEQDINWMMNNGKLLNPECFEYLDKALAAHRGEKGKG
jgi:predicted DNA-binding protein (UPF0251 family)